MKIRSLFIKLLVIFFGAILLLAVGLGFIHHEVAGSAPGATFRRHLSHYAELLAHEIGTPPDVDKARAVARERDIEIEIVGPGTAFKTAGFPAFSGAGWITPRSAGLPVTFLRKRGRIGVQLQQGEYRLTFSPVFPEPVNLWKLWLISALWLSVVLVGTYFVVSHLLGPVRILVYGVNRLSSGDLKFRLPECRGSEFRSISRAFNAMAEKVLEMIRARDQLLLDVSHEYRSPLTRMKVALELLPDSPATRGMADDLRDLESMTSEILESAHMDSEPGGIKKTDISVRELFAPMREMFRSERVEWSFDPSVVDAVLSLDAQKMRLALKNLIDNALKYAPDSPILVGAVRESREDGRTECCLFVRDRGPGIPLAEQQRIFEPFYRVERSRSRGGFGLGLSLVKKVVEVHDGRVELKSSPGDGACFRVVLKTAE